MSNYPQPTQNYPYPNYPPGNFNPPFPPANNFPQPTGYPFQPQNIMDQSNPGYPNPAVSPGYPQPGVPQNYPQPGVVPQNYPQPGVVPQNYPQPGVVPQNYPQPGTCGDYPNTSGTGPLPAVCPSAPDPSQMQNIPGYEGLTFEDAVLVPPTVPVWEPDQQEQKPLQNLPVLSEEEVHEAALEFASDHCCYGSAAARDMDIKEIIMMSAFHYKVETYTEKRESAWRFLPYIGQAIDGPSNGPAPSPWDVPAVPNEYFKNSKAKIEVPHTAFVKPCHTCVGNARVRCSTCEGNGRKQCTWCKGRGRRSNFDRDEVCTSCNGTGYDRCFKCDGTGQVKCKTCEGKGNLKGFVELTVTWTNHTDDYISETYNMPKELVLGVTGQVAYEEENPRVFPINHATDIAVRNASNELVAKHGSAFTNERILRQRQCLRAVPIGRVKYQWKDKVDEFFVYGYEHKVYFQEYPQKCCCCTIL